MVLHETNNRTVNISRVILNQKGNFKFFIHLFTFWNSLKEKFPSLSSYDTLNFQEFRSSFDNTQTCIFPYVKILFFLGIPSNKYLKNKQWSYYQKSAMLQTYNFLWWHWFRKAAEPYPTVGLRQVNLSTTLFDLHFSRMLWS